MDNASTTKPYFEVIEYENEINNKFYGNPSSLHKMGFEGEKIVGLARDRIASTLNCSGGEIIFTSGGTEANNLALGGYLKAAGFGKNHIITCKTEHPSVLNVFKYFEGAGYDVDYLEVHRDKGIDTAELKDKLREETALISIMHTNNETGAINPVEEILDTVKGYNGDIAMHVDAIQAYGKIRLDLKSTGFDMVSLSGHKIHGPKGVGALFVREKLKMKPLILGGGQEKNLRSGTENTAGIGGFGLAASMICRDLDHNYEKVKGLKGAFCDFLHGFGVKFKVLSPQDASPYILCLSFDSIRGEVLLHHLAQRNIYISTGSACSSKKHQKNHVLLALGYTDRIIDRSIRISFNSHNTMEEVEKAARSMGEIITNMERILGKNV